MTIKSVLTRLSPNKLILLIILSQTMNRYIHLSIWNSQQEVIIDKYLSILKSEYLNIKSA